MALDITRNSMRVLVSLALLCGVGCARPDDKTLSERNIPVDSSCAFVRVNAHKNADSLLHEFVARDARGEFRQSSSWFDGAVDCPGHEPAPDQTTIVSAYRLDILSRTSDSVRAIVTWERVAYGGQAVDALVPGREVDSVVAVRTSYGWRIASPALNPHELVKPPSRP